MKTRILVLLLAASGCSQGVRDPFRVGPPGTLPGGPPPVAEFVNPPNGSRDVARFPVFSVRFRNAIDEDPSGMVELLDREGTSIPLTVRRSANDDQLAVATLASTDDRLDVGADYFLRTPGPGGGFDSTHFVTGGLKSIGCVELDDADVLVNGCDEAAWRDDEAFGVDGTCTTQVADDPCQCYTDATNPHLGLPRAYCSCEDETALLDGAGTVVAKVDPAPGANVEEVDPDTPIRIVLDGDVDASRYRLVVTDITDPAADPTSRETLIASPSYDEAKGELYLDAEDLGDFSFASDARYRVTLELDPSTGVPAASEDPIVGPYPFGTTWTFNTWTGPIGSLNRMLPAAEGSDVDFPTHLPLLPHLRFVLDGPIPRGLSATDKSPLRVVRHDGVAVTGFAAWVDVDLHRLHLMFYEPLDPGQRYTVLCSEDLAELAGPALCDPSDPLGHFLTQVPADEITSDIRVGTRVALQEEAGELWLPVRASVLNRSHGYKERYAVDAVGPTQYLDHVMVVPTYDREDEIVATIRVSREEGCRSLPPGPIAHIKDYQYTETACVDDDDCPETYECRDCSGNATTNDYCPDTEMRCQQRRDLLQDLVYDHCLALIDGGEKACEIADAYACVHGGGSIDATAGQAPQSLDGVDCPTGYALDDDYGCLPLGRVRLALGPGEHDFTAPYNAKWGAHFDEDGALVTGSGPPVVIEPADPQGDGILEPTVVTFTTPLPGDGLALPDDTCHVTTGGDLECGINNGVCQLLDGQGVCIPAAPETPEPCVVPEEGEDDGCEDGFTCDSDSGRCIIDLQWRSDGGAPAFSCVDATHYKGCTAHWIEVEDDIWRIWWPGKPTASGASRDSAVFRISDPGDPSSGVRVPQVLQGPDYTDYEETWESPEIMDACSEFNRSDYAGQLEHMLRVLAAQDDVPHAAYATGYLEFYANASETAPDCGWVRHLDYGTPSEDLVGPRGVFVKLPAGTSPSDYDIEASPRYGMGLYFANRWDLRGLVFEAAPSTTIFAGSTVGLSFRGNQAHNAIHTLVYMVESDDRPTDDVVVSDNYFNGSGAIDSQTDTSHTEVEGNVFWHMNSKLTIMQYKGDETIVPTLCTADDGDACVRPACAVDHDCRIPFIDVLSTETEDITCDGVDHGVGTCSHGTIDQALFTDNVIVHGPGPNNGPYYNYRSQRNHHEAVGNQEGFDATNGATWTSVLDNQVYLATPALTSVKVNHNDKRADYVAVDGNAFINVGPGRLSQNLFRQRKSLFPGGSGTVGITADETYPSHVEISNNRFVDPPGSYEYGRAYGISVANIDNLEIHSNTMSGDYSYGISVVASAVANPIISVEDNLILGNTRESFEDNVCKGNGVDIKVDVSGEGITVDNYSLVPPEGDPSPYDHSNLLFEPRPRSAAVDMELFQSHLTRFQPRAEEELTAYERFPGYDPAWLEDGMLARYGILYGEKQVCEYGVGTEDDCIDPDSDGDQYADAIDNCPETFNPSQADSDGDGNGDAC